MDLTALKNLQTVGTDAFGQMPELKTVTLSESQAQTINPGVFSGVEEDSDSSLSISVMQDSNQGQAATSFSPTSWPSTTVTVANNLNRFASTITEINLAATNVTTLAGGVLWGNESITKLVLPATATQWKVTEPKDYKTSPIGYLSENNSSGLLKSGSIEFLNFNSNASNTPASSFTDIDWSLVANILNMFGYVGESQSDNLSIWAEGFKDPDLDGDSVKRGWSSDQNNQTWPGGQSITSTSSSPLYKLVNGVTWTYKNDTGSNSITLTASTANLYRAGYTGNAFAYFQVGFGDNGSGKIDHTKTVTVTLKLVGA